MARQTAAFALASAFDAKTTELLITSVKGGGVAQAPAAAALVAYPPMQVGAFTNANVGAPAVLRLVAQLGDLRALDAVRAAARASDPQVRGAAIATLGEMGDMRALDFTTAALKEHDARVRAGAAQALVALGVEGAATAVIGLIRDDATAILGMRLAERVPQPADGSAAATDDLVTALAARAASADVAMRAQAIAALARLPSGVAVRALVSLLKDPSLHSDVANAIARSPSGDAMAALEAMAADATYARLAARGYVVRALTRGETSARVEDVIAELAASRDGRDRATGTFALVALGKRAAADTLGDPDARVRRATAMASLAGGGDAGVTTRAALLARLMVEQDEATRSVLAVGLLDGDPDARVPTLTLIDRAEAAAPDSGLAAFALARRSDDAQRAKVDALLGSADPVLRAHTARGIGASSAKDATGRLATAYAYEGEAMVRRAIVFALGSRSASEGDANAPQRMTTLHVAARLDADLVVRTMATRALAGLRVTQTPGAGSARAVAWLHLTTADGQPPPADMTGSVVRADGVAVPIAFDDEGYAIVPGMPPGDAQLVLAPRLPSYESGKP